MRSTAESVHGRADAEIVCVRVSEDDAVWREGRQAEGGCGDVWVCTAWRRAAGVRSVRRGGGEGARGEDTCSSVRKIFFKKHNGSVC